MAEITRLSNGLRVVTETAPHLKSAALGVWVGAGARHETPEMNGISHMLEHMAFKGTRRRSAQGIAEEVEAAGGQINAFTSREFTGYLVRVLEPEVPLAMDILADILQDSVFDREELERERGVVLQEIGEVADTPDDIIFDYLQESAYPDHALGRPVLGTPETVAAFEPDHLKAYMGARYHPADMVLAAAGKVDHAQIVDLAERLFTRLPETAEKDGSRASYGGGLVRKDRDLEQLHMALAFDGVAYDDRDYFAMQVLANLFGGGMSSRLFQEVREKRGLAYSIFSFASSYTDGGLFGVYAGTGAAQGSDLLAVVADELDGLLGDIGEEELARARAQLKAGIVMALESPAAQAEQLARQLLIYGRTYSADDMIREIEAVDAGALKRVAARISAARPTLALLGPASEVRIPDRLAP